jgi:hypothetical protein
MSSSARPICRTLLQTGFMVSSKDLSTIFLSTTVSSMAMAKIFSPFFRLAALRTFAGMTTCPFEETLVVDASTKTSPYDSKNFLTYNDGAGKKLREVDVERQLIPGLTTYDTQSHPVLEGHPDGK